MGPRGRMGRAEAEGVTLHKGKPQDCQLSAFLFSPTRQMALHLEMLNNYLEEEIESG